MGTIIQRGAVWRAQVRLGGVSFSATRNTREEAATWIEREEARIRLDAERGNPKPTSATILPNNLTVAGLLDKYAKEVSRTKKTEANEVRRLARLSKSFPMPVADLKPADIRVWRATRTTEVCGASVLRDKGILSAVFTHAIEEWGLEMANPFASVKKWPSNSPHRERRVSPAERAAIMAAFEWDEVSPPETLRQWVAWSWALALESMLRRGEIVNLRWGNVFERHVVLDDSKNGTKNAKVPISSRTRALLAMLTREADNVRIVRLSADSITTCFTRACAKAGIKGMHFHDSRHESITTLAPRFRDALHLSAVSRHKDLKSLKRYYNPTTDELADAMG